MSTVTFLSEVLKHSPDHYKPDVAYEFGIDRKRKFMNSDMGKTGIYGYSYIVGDDGEYITGDDGEFITGDNE